MDVDNIDPRADEAVQRIQNTLRKMDAKAKATRASNASHTVLTGMLEELTSSADEATKNSEAYQYLAAQPHVTGVLSEAVHQMTSIAVNVSKVLKDEHGIQIDRPGYKLLKALAWHNENITEDAKKRNDPNWSAKGVWEIERILRESAPWTDPNGARDLIRVSTTENSDDYTKAVNALTSEIGMSSVAATKEVQIILGALRGKPYLTEAQEEDIARDARASAAVNKVIKDYFASDEGKDIKSYFKTEAGDVIEVDAEEELLDPDTEPWDKHLVPAEAEKTDD